MFVIKNNYVSDKEKGEMCVTTKTMFIRINNVARTLFVARFKYINCRTSNSKNMYRNLIFYNYNTRYFTYISYPFVFRVVWSNTSNV